MHLLALRISEFLGLKPDHVLKHWPCAKVSKARPTVTETGHSSRRFATTVNLLNLPLVSDFSSRWWSKLLQQPLENETDGKIKFFVDETIRACLLDSKSDRLRTFCPPSCRELRVTRRRLSHTLPNVIRQRGGWRSAAKESKDRNDKA